MRPAEGETYTYERTFTEEDVGQFTAVTGDDQPRHTEPDESGRLLVHGLLSGSLLTKIGGDIGILASEISLRFQRPVYTGDTIVCEWTNETVTAHQKGWLVEASVVTRCTDSPRTAIDAGDVVLRATVEGLVED